MMLGIKTRNNNINKEIFSNAINKANEELISKGYNPIVSISPEAMGEYCITWYNLDGTRNILSYSTIENIGIYCSHKQWEENFTIVLRLGEFLNICNTL